MEEQFSRSLVGCFGDSSDSVPLLSSLKGWVHARWALRGGLKISKLGGAFLLLEFENKCEADMVLLRGNKWFKRESFICKDGDPEVGCFWNGSHAKEVWVRIVGLPLHFWSREVFKRIKEKCGVFIAVDEETTLFSQLQWARILVRATEKDLPGSP